jgi:hypothetical protein
MYLGTLPFTCFDTLDRLHVTSYWSGLDEAPSYTREDYRGALREFFLANLLSLNHR